MSETPYRIDMQFNVDGALAMSHKLWDSFIEKFISKFIVEFNLHEPDYSGSFVSPNGLDYNGTVDIGWWLDEGLPAGFDETLCKERAAIVAQECGLGKIHIEIFDNSAELED